MGYEALLLLLAILLTLPAALWMRARARRGLSRDPRRSIALTFAGILVLLLALSGLAGYFYPYGLPGSEDRVLRASALACRDAYAAARNAHDSARVDGEFRRPTAGAIVLSCGALRRERLPRCEPGSECARARAALRLPGE